MARAVMAVHELEASSGVAGQFSCILKKPTQNASPELMLSVGTPWLARRSCFLRAQPVTRAALQYYSASIGRPPFFSLATLPSA